MQCNYKTRILLAYLVQDGSAKKHPFSINVQFGSIKDTVYHSFIILLNRYAEHGIRIKKLIDYMEEMNIILTFQYIFIYLNSRAECKHLYLHSNSLLDTKGLEGQPDRKPLQLYELTFDKRLTKYKQISENKNKP